MKGFFGIASPSKVMKKMFEDDWGGGIVQGVNRAAKNVRKAVQNVNEAATPEIDTQDLGDVNMPSNGTRRGGNVVFVQNNYSPKALSPYDTYRQGLKLSQTLAAGVK